MARRNEFDIRADILNLCRVPRLKTEIVYKCNMNFRNIERYINLLIEEGHLMIAENRGKRTQYESTTMGLDWLTGAVKIGVGTFYERDIAPTFV